MDTDFINIDSPLNSLSDENLRNILLFGCDKFNNIAYHNILLLSIKFTKDSHTFKVNRSVYIANRTYQFCERCKTYQYEKRIELNKIS